MSQKLARYKINQALRLISHNSLRGSKEGFIKVSSNTSLIHAQKVLEVAYKLKKQGYLVYSEVKFLDNSLGRCDLLVFDEDGNPTIIEVLHSETDKKLCEKLAKYPIEFAILTISTKDDVTDLVI